MTNTYHCIYGIVHRWSAKRYIGVHSGILPPVKDIGVIYFSSSSDEDFQLEQYMYPERFIYEILVEFDTREEAVEHEIELHSRYNVKDNIDFYNLANQTPNGFDGGVGAKHFRARPIYQCDKDTGEIIKEWDYIELAAKTLKINGSDITGCARGRQQVIGGYIWIYKEDYTKELAEEKSNFIDGRKGKNHAAARSVYQCDKDTGKIIKGWSCISDAARALNIGTSDIGACARGNQLTAGGFVWVYKENYDEVKEEELKTRIYDKNRSNNPNAKIILQLDEDRKILKIWNCILDAAEYLNISKSGISQCSNGRSKTSGGFGWIKLKKIKGHLWSEKENNE